MTNYKKYTALCTLFLTHIVSGYGLPGLGLGYTNILDGGPVRPYPGIYYQQWLQYYTTKRFLNAEGKPLGGLPSPRFRGLVTVPELIYQFGYQGPLGGMPGVMIAVPFTLVSKIEKNALDIESSGGGVGNLYLGAYTQWSAIFLKDRPFFIHRFELNASIPMGKNKLPKKQINPSNSFFYGGTNWSATLFLSRKWSLSWALHYVWSAKNEKIDFQAGDVIYCNYSLAYEAYPRLYIGAVGYALKQIHENKALGVRLKNSKERVFGTGPGVVYFFPSEIDVFGYLYLENGVRNRTQGTSFIFRFIKHF